MDENLIARTVRRVLSETGSTAHMSLKLAEALAAKVEERAESLGMRVVTAIADEAGHPKLVRSMDGAYIGSLDVAVSLYKHSVPDVHSGAGRTQPAGCPALWHPAYQRRQDCDFRRRRTAYGKW